MKNIDFLALDGRSLRAFLVVLDELSVSKAAVRLGVTQSAVSHLLDKLRIALGDPLFVRAGRGIAPTDRALALRQPVQAVLDGLKGLTDERVFEPTIGEHEFTIAANDFQRDLIFPDLIRRLTDEDVNARFRFIPSGIPDTDVLRQARCQLLITPFPPEGPDIYQSRLFDDEEACFYDESVRGAPKTKTEFKAAEFIEVRFDDQAIASKPVEDDPDMAPRKPRVSVTSFSALPAFLKGTDLITVLPSLMGQVNLKGFAWAPLPFKTRRFTMYMTWHRRDHLDPAHQWLRERIKQCVEELTCHK